MAEFLEHGAIAFVYRPRVQTAVARGIEDVQAFWVVLASSDRDRARRIRVGRKRLPDGGRHERFWAYVDRIGRRAADVVDDLAAAEYWTKTRGLRHQPGPRLAGQGAYALATHGTHHHLVYALSTAERASEVREDLRIAPQGSYIVAAFAESVGAEQRGSEETRRFVPLEPRHLDTPGSEMVLIATGDALAAEVGDALDPSSEAATARALHAQVRSLSGLPASAPLFDGVWR